MTRYDVGMLVALTAANFSFFVAVWTAILYPKVGIPLLIGSAVVLTMVYVRIGRDAD